MWSAKHDFLTSPFIAQTINLGDLRYSLLVVADSTNAAWENPATEQIKSMATAALWGIPLALVLWVALTAAFFSAIMPVIDRMFYSTLEEEMNAYLPDVWAEYQKELQQSGETLSSRKDMQMQMWDDLAEYKAGKLREMYLSRLGKNPIIANDKDYYQKVWDRANSLLEEGEELENRPDLIAMLEEGLLKEPKGNTVPKTKKATASQSTAENGFTSIVGNELNRVDLIMRLFDKTTEFTGKSRLKIYKDWDDWHDKT
jgi:hypothetical protein